MLECTRRSVSTNFLFTTDDTAYTNHDFLHRLNVEKCYFPTLYILYYIYCMLMCSKVWNLLFKRGYVCTCIGFGVLDTHFVQPVIVSSCYYCAWRGTLVAIMKEHSEPTRANIMTSRPRKNTSSSVQRILCRLNLLFQQCKSITFIKNEISLLY